MDVDLVYASGHAGSSEYIVDKDFCCLSWKAVFLALAVFELPH